MNLYIYTSIHLYIYTYEAFSETKTIAYEMNQHPRVYKGLYLFRRKTIYKLFWWIDSRKAIEYVNSIMDH